MGAVKMLRVGLTGGIGSGKTTVANLFEKLSVPVIDADIISHQLTQKEAAGYKEIVAHFGNTILQEDGALNRKKLRNIIFEDPAEKIWLENCLHPLIRATMRSEIKKYHAPYCICVIPLLAESTGIDFIDRVLVIDLPITQQIERAKKRDVASTESIKKIIGTQASQAARLKIADDIITNDSDLQSLEKQVLRLHQQYLKV